MEALLNSVVLIAAGPMVIKLFRFKAGQRAFEAIRNTIVTDEK